MKTAALFTLLAGEHRPFQNLAGAGLSRAHSGIRTPDPAHRARQEREGPQTALVLELLPPAAIGWPAFPMASPGSSWPSARPGSALSEAKQCLAWLTHGCICCPAGASAVSARKLLQAPAPAPGPSAVLAPVSCPAERLMVEPRASRPVSSEGQLHAVTSALAFSTLPWLWGRLDFARMQAAALVLRVSRSPAFGVA